MLLDTNVLIYAAMRDDLKHTAVRDFLHRGDGFYVSALTRVELLGWAGATPDDLVLREAIYDALTELAIDRPVLDLAAQLRRQRRGVQTADAILAATALHYALPIVTCNVRDFAWIERLAVIDPSVSG